MREFYSDFLKDDLWFIKENEWSKSLQNIRESQFAIGNGYLGIRGVLEEIPYNAMAGTYLAGIYDKMGSQVDELVNLPNPVNFKFTIEGEKLDLYAAKVIEHKRILNMKKALLIRHTLYEDAKKRHYDYQSLRFVSLHNKNIGVMQIALTALDADCIVDINTGIDTSISNAGIISEGRKRHFRIRELGQRQEAGYLVIETLEKRHIITFWAGFYYEIDGKKHYSEDNIFRLRFKKGKTIRFTKIFHIKHYPYKRDHSGYKKKSFRAFNKIFRAEFSNLISEHIRMWHRLWKKADIVIEGQEDLQTNLRFNIYHMLICAHYDNGFSSIGARTLSGEGYRGHIFWDSEIFLMPFYLFNFPEVAQNILLYRYRRLDEARRLARLEGYEGAKFAWESAATGDEETPEWARDFDGTIIKISTHKQEHHITADIAYAIYKYYIVSQDERFMQKYGYEMFFETARFWASRVKYNKKRGKYEIRGVIGPDEFHQNVNNNAFTNIMAKWNLITACKLLSEVKKDSSVYKKIKKKINLKEKEAKNWRRIAAGLGVNINKKGVIEQFDGFFKLKKVILTQTDENGIPLIPKRLKAKDLGKTNLIKQADVLMMLYLLDDVFSQETKITNYNYYINKTVHKSSLSSSIHSIIACRVGDLNRAFNFFNVSLHTDIANFYGNTCEGIHAASLGGSWQAVIFGFAGVKIKKERLFIDPYLPRGWNRLIFSLIWKGDNIKFEVTNQMIKLKALSTKRKEVELGIFGKLMRVKTNKMQSFKRSQIKEKKEEFY